MASETGLYKHHCLPVHIPSSSCLLFFASNLPSLWKIYHTNGNFLIFIFGNNIKELRHKFVISFSQSIRIIHQMPYKI